MDGNIEAAINMESSGSNVSCKDASQVKYRPTLIMWYDEMFQSCLKYFMEMWDGSLFDNDFIF